MKLVCIGKKDSTKKKKTLKEMLLSYDKVSNIMVYIAAGMTRESNTFMHVKFVTAFHIAN